MLPSATSITEVQGWTPVCLPHPSCFDELQQHQVSLHPRALCCKKCYNGQSNLSHPNLWYWEQTPSHCTALNWTHLKKKKKSSCPLPQQVNFSTLKALSLIFALHLSFLNISLWEQRRDRMRIFGTEHRPYLSRAPNMTNTKEEVREWSILQGNFQTPVWIVIKHSKGKQHSTTADIKAAPLHWYGYKVTYVNNKKNELS